MDRKVLQKCDMTELLRWLHLIAMAFFVGGQILLAFVVVPALRGGAKGPLDAAKRTVVRRAARRFGTGSLIALAVLVATGVGMAGEFGSWDETALHVKLALVVAVIGLIGWHAKRPEKHWLAGVVLAVSLAIVWFAVQLAH